MLQTPSRLQKQPKSYFTNSCNRLVNFSNFTLESVHNRLKLTLNTRWCWHNVRV